MIHDLTGIFFICVGDAPSPHPPTQKEKKGKFLDVPLGLHEHLMFDLVAEKISDCEK